MTAQIASPTALSNLSWGGGPLSPQLTTSFSGNDDLLRTGSSNKLDAEHTALVGTTFYRSPEMEEGSSGFYTDKVKLT